MGSSQEKEIKIRLPLDLHEKFFRAFPGYGERSTIIRKLVTRLVDRCESEPEFLDSIIEVLRDE
jgi:metal-responsive CopG/Arc/MetJ family transcriptional regulator